MNKYDAFFNRIVSDKDLVNSFKLLEGKSWEALSFNKRKNLFVYIVSKISGFYPELGKPKFDFMVLEDGQGGEDSEEGTYLNVKMLEDGNHFEVLATFIHEIRHFYQRKVVSLYEKKDVIHEMFTKEEIESFSENLLRSIFMSVDNYMESSDINDVEYKLQPIEYDAENFSYEFMKRFSNRFLSDEYDLMNCRSANMGFDKIKELYEGNKDDIISFNKIYLYNYKDYVNDNKSVIKSEKEKYRKYINLLNKLYYLNDKQIFTLLNPGFLYKCNEDTVMNILNSYLEFNGSETRIIKDGNEYYYNDLLFDIHETLSYRLVEPLFLQVADEKIAKISSKDLKDISNSVERDVKINLMDKNNFIEESNHPLLYRLQPSVLYRDMFLRDEYLKLIRAIDEPYDDYNSFFEDFVTYIKKYDYVQLMKKAEILLGKEFDEIYKEMLRKMNENIKMEKKAK